MPDLQIENLQSVPPGSSLRVCIYGPPNSGKTTLGTKFPKPLFLDCDDGMERLKGDDIDRILVTSFGMLEEQLDLLVKAKGGGYETIVLDTITTAQLQLEVELLAASKNDTLEMREWGKMRTRISDLLLKITQLPWHVLILAHSYERITDNDPVTIVPEVRGSAQGILRAHCSIIGYLTATPAWEIVNGKRQVTGTQRTVSLTGDGTYYTRNRSRLTEAPELTVEEFGEIVSSLPTKGADPAQPEGGEQDESGPQRVRAAKAAKPSNGDQHIPPARA